MENVKKIFERLGSLLDKSAWIMMVIGMLILGFSDFELLVTLVKWISFTFIVAGVSIFLSRITFSTIDFKEFLEMVRQGNVAAGLVMGAVVLYVAIVGLSVIIWAK